MNEATIWAAVISGGFAVIGSFLANLHLHNRSLKAKKDAVTVALIEEVRAIKDIAVKRHYLGHIEKIIALLEQNPGATHSIHAKIPDHYSRIYQSLAADIGVLDACLAGKIVRFHQLVDAVVQDMVPGGSFNTSGKLENYRTTAAIFRIALQVADEILAYKAP